MALANEKWKEVPFDFKFTNDYKLEVSNMGNLRAHNKFSPGEPLQGSTINGYRIIRLKLYRPKDKKTQAALDAKHATIVALRSKIRGLAQDPKKNKSAISEAKTKLESLTDSLRNARAMDVKNRTKHYHSLFHRLVADNFVKPKSPKHTVVGHLDYNKKNNKASNLVWMTPEENYKHQQSSPHVIKEKRDRVTKYRDEPRGAKLSVEQVGQIKKAFAEGKTGTAIAKKFKITDTQALRIKKGLNWKHVKAAK